MSRSSASGRALPLGAIAIYGLPAAALAFTENLLSFYLLKFSTDVLLVAPAWMGLWFGISKAWDAVTDPVVGYWSDRTHTRLGRRRPWMLASVLPLAVVFVALWSPPASLGSAALAWWMGVAVVFFFTAQTIFAVPHLALGAELAPAGHERTRLFAWRMALNLIGVLAAAIGLGVLERGGDPRGFAVWIALGAAAAVVVFVTGSALRLREPSAHQGRGARSSRQAYGDVLGNPHARRLFVVIFLESLGFVAMTTSLPYANDYALQQSGTTSFLLLGAIGAMLLTVPLWLALARRYGKLRVWIGSLAVRSLAFGSMAFVGEGGGLTMVVSVVVIGAMFGCGVMLSPAVKSDVIDDDERRSGQRKEGAYFAAWNLATKGAAGAAIALSGTVLSVSGFAPNVEQAPAALLGIRALFAGLPCLFYGVAAVLLSGFSLYGGDEAVRFGEPTPTALRG